MAFIKTLGSCAAALAVAVTAGSAAAKAPETDKPIKVVLNNWTSQLVLARIAGGVLSEMGYTVEYKPSDTQLQYPAMGLGDLHLQVEVWEGTMKTPFMKEVEAGRMIDAGSHDAKTREDWYYPEYVEEICPGLPDWRAINDCADKLATPETYPKARYLAGPVDWEKPDQERVEALGLDVKVVNAGQAAALWAELDAAFKRKEPIILFNWTPNWVEAEYPGKFVEFPEYDPKCETDPSWGINPDKAYDCGNPKAGWLKKGVWSGFPDTWPCGFEMIENFNFGNEAIAQAAAKVDVEEMSPEEAANEWIGNHKETWQGWIPADCRAQAS